MAATLPDSMTAWSCDAPAPAPSLPLTMRSRPLPRPCPDEVLLKVSACGICRTDLHLIEGDLVPRRPGVVPGHQVVGRVVASGESQTRFAIGDRVGIAWLRATCGACRWCRRGEENLCPGSRYTGWDADGGFAEYAVVPAAFAYRLPHTLTDALATPLLCAGIIGYRALRRSSLPPGGRLGIYGFGSSGHITAQLALALGAEVFVMTRAAAARDLAGELGASWVGGPSDPPPERLDSAIVFAPVGGLVPAALEALDRGGTLALAGIHMSDIPSLDYGRHLFQERSVRSVTANTRADGEELMRLAARLPLDVHVIEYGFDSVPRALLDLATDRFSGSAVVTGFPS